MLDEKRTPNTNVSASARRRWFPRRLLPRIGIQSALLAMVPLGVAFYFLGELVRHRGRMPLDNQFEASRFLQQKLATKTSEELAVLQQHHDVNIALHAGWERAKEDETERRTFIEQLNAKLGGVVPDWWGESVQRVRINSGRNHCFSDVESPNAPCLLRFVDEDFEVIAHPGGSGFPFGIHKRALPAGSVSWANRVWAIGRQGLIGHHPPHRVEMIVGNDRVYVFGIEMFGAYVEGFHLHDGSPFLRFCTSYWGNYPERW